MPKSVSPGTISAAGQTFVANAVPDPFDERDLEYRPRLTPLPAKVDQRAARRTVLRQEGSSCTGHAVAAMANTILAGEVGRRRTTVPRVSPYMFYRLARRYDEFPGEKDAGSSLRGVFKGWFNHGIAREATWPRLKMDPEPDLEDENFIRKCQEIPLGAFYRINPFRLDDMQSAINELHAVAVSSVIHEGWAQPVRARDRRASKWTWVIQRSDDSAAVGGHAYVLVGYNSLGFLVQNSWGTDWGNGGFATLPYDEWLDSAYDAWVARHGVPHTPFATARTSTTIATGGELATAPGTDLRRLRMHVVNLANNGRLSQSGKFTSSPAQIEGILVEADRCHARWSGDGDAPRRIVLYAHGGVVDEAAGLRLADGQVDWWLNNRVYPIFFVWQSGPLETAAGFLVDRLTQLLPFGAPGFDLLENVDRLVERVSRSKLWWMWQEMRDNATGASGPLDEAELQWPPTSTAAIEAMAELPGGSLLADRLARYVTAHPETEVHLVAHSAGTIFHTGMLRALGQAGVPITSLAFMGAALRADEFERQVQPLIGKKKHVGQFANFVLSDARELDDTCQAGDLTFYNKSLLYLVARGFERPKADEPSEIPLVGMARFLERPLDDGTTLRERIEHAGGSVIIAPANLPGVGASHAAGHGDFDDDASTMGSVLFQILGRPGSPFQRNAPPASAPAGPGEGAASPDQPFAAAAANPPGLEPMSETRPVDEESREAAGKTASTPLRSASDTARHRSPIIDVLRSEGWEVEE